MSLDGIESKLAICFVGEISWSQLSFRKIWYGRRQEEAMETFQDGEAATIALPAGYPLVQ